jgi:hypothetical protein
MLFYQIWLIIIWLYLGQDYAVRREFILQLLKNYGFHINFEPQGSVFVFAELPKSWQISDVSSFYIVNYCWSMRHQYNLSIQAFEQTIVNLTGK